MSKIIIARIVPYTGTDAALTALNPTPNQSEIVVVKPPSGTGYRLKIGDGLTPYASLPFFTAGSGSPETLQDVLNLGYTAVDNPGTTNGRIVLNNTAGGVTTIIPAQVQVNGPTDTLQLNLASLTYLRGGNRMNINFPAPTALRNILFQDGSGTLAFLSDITSAGTFQGVLNAGNSAVAGGGNTGKFFLSVVGGAGNYITLDPANNAGLTIQNGTSGGQVLARLISGSGSGFLSLRNTASASSFLATLKSGVLSGNRAYLLPDEGSGGTIDDTIVLHKTKDSITVGNTATAWVVLNSSGWNESNKQVSLTELQGALNVPYGFLFKWENTSGSPFTYANVLQGWKGSAGATAPPGGSGSFVVTMPQFSCDLIGNVVDGDIAGITATSNHVLATYSLPNQNQSFLINGYANITAIAGLTLQMQVSFIDIHGSGQTLTLNMVNTTGAVSQNMVATGYYYNTTTTVRAAAGSTVAVDIIITGVGTNTYDAGATITQTK